MTGNFKASWFCKILDKFTRTDKLIWITGDLDNQCLDKWISTVHKYVQLQT